jgi:ribosomal-protein-alanine N-acetyltransferase
MADGGPILREAFARDAPIAAALHAEGFAGRERSWSAAEFDALLAIPGSFLLLASPGPDLPDAGLLLGRGLAGEAELLTLATAPGARRAGIARALLDRFAEEAAARGAETAFLEVAEDNAAARALYIQSGWTAVGRRKAYVKRVDGSRMDAIVMQISGL